VLQDQFCGGASAPPGSTIQFQTELVGGSNNNTPVDLGIGFTWQSDYNGTSGGIATTVNLRPSDPSSGTGGSTITGINSTTNYQPTPVPEPTENIWLSGGILLIIDLISRLTKFRGIPCHRF